MKRSRFTEEQIIGILKEHQAGLGAKELCRKHGVSDATFYKWRAKFGNKTAPAHDLSGYPMVQDVLAGMALPKFGPLIVNENTGLPYWNREYTKLWRTIAKAVGVPDDVWSMDTRAGAVTEVEEALGISIAGKFAGHSNPRTTLGHVRDDGVKVSRLVADARRKMRVS